MSGRIKSGIRKELFGVIFFILVVNVVVLLFMGSTLFERFYQSNKVSELEQSARAIRAAYQENSRGNLRRDRETGKRQRDREPL